MLVRRGGFLYNFCTIGPFVFFVDFLGWPFLKLKSTEPAETPYFVVFSHLIFCNPLKRPNRKVTLFLG